MIGDKILYVRFYERIDESREMITKKYYDLDEERAPNKPAYYEEKIGDVWPLETFLEDIVEAAGKK